MSSEYFDKIAPSVPITYLNEGGFACGHFDHCATKAPNISWRAIAALSVINYFGRHVLQCA